MSYFGQSVENESFNTLVPIERFYPDLAPNTVSNATSESSSEPLFQGTRILYWYHPDYVSNVDLVTDVNGEAYELFLYNAWGESLHHWISNSSNSWSSPYRFNSKELDPETGMHYYGARYHHPKLSVWMSVDPLVIITGESYVYTSNNPIELLDPNGLSPVDGDPVKTPRIAPTPRAGLKGGLMGNHRRNADGTPRPHRGVDILAPKGTEIKTIISGKVIASGKSSTFGYYVLVRSVNESGEGGEYIFTLYAHLMKEGRAKGDISEGDVVGVQGNSGNAKDLPEEREHVHIETSIGDTYTESKGNRVDPLQYFDTKFDSEGLPLPEEPIEVMPKKINIKIYEPKTPELIKLPSL